MRQSNDRTPRTGLRDPGESRMAVPFFEAIRNGDEAKAEAIALTAIESGLSAFELATQLIVPALARIGDLWHEGKLSISEEHLATQISFRLFERLRGRTKRRPPIGHRAVVTTVEGEAHSLGARLAAEMLYTDGWDVDYLGADTPSDDLVAFSRQRAASLVVLSVILAENLDSAASALSKLKSMSVPPFVIVGGGAVESAVGEAFLGQADALVNDHRHLPVAARALIGRPERDTLEDYLIDIGQRVQELRRLKGWSQTDLATAAGLDRTYVSGVERGRQNLSLGVLVKLADALGATLDSFLNREP